MRSSISSVRLSRFASLNLSFQCSFATSSNSGDLLETAESQHKVDRHAVQRQMFYNTFKTNRYYTNKRLRYIFGDVYQPNLDTKLIFDSFQSVPNLPKIEGEILFGIHPTLLALQSSHRRITRMYLKLRELTDEGEEIRDTDNIKTILRLGRLQNIPTSIVPLKVLDSLARNRPHQGVCLDVSPIDYVRIDLNDVANMIQTETSEQPKHNRHHLVFLYLDKVLDIMNFGAILRTAYYMGIDHVFVQEGRCAKITPMASKASSGVLELMPVYQVADGKDFLLKCKENSFKIVGTTQPSTINTVPSVSIDEFKLQCPTVLIMGNEGVGIADELAAVCDSFLFVQARRLLHEGVGSLNVSVATGILEDPGLAICLLLFNYQRLQRFYFIQLQGPEGS